MAKTNQIYVTIRENGWAVIKAGAERALKVFSTQKEAQIYANEIAKKEGATVIVQNKEGKFRKS